MTLLFYSSGTTLLFHKLFGSILHAPLLLKRSEGRPPPLLNRSKTITVRGFDSAILRNPNREAKQTARKSIGGKAPRKHLATKDRIVKPRMELDMMSNLPTDITNEILSRVPLRDAVRTSILSSKWRNKWKTLSRLKFDPQLVSVPIKTTFEQIVDRVLLLHRGPTSYIFKLSCDAGLDFSHVDRWISFLSSSSLRELIMVMRNDLPYNLPSYFYSCQDLIFLELRFCALRPPSTFNVFPCLTSLNLQNFKMTQDAFENLISRCPLLETLVVKFFESFTHLNIRAPKLKYFETEGDFYEVNFKNAFCLTEAILSLSEYPNDESIAHGNAGNLVKFFTDVPHIQRLHVESYFINYLAIGNVLTKLSCPCVDLKYLKITIDFHNLKENLTALCILRSSPNLEQLVVTSCCNIDAGVATSTSVSEQEHLLPPFGQLRGVKICYVSWVKPELDFLRFILANSPVLGRMTIQTSSTNRRWEFLKELVRFRRASGQAEIIVID